MLKSCLYFPLLMFFKEFFNYKLLFNCEYQNKSPEAYSTTNIFRLPRRLWRNNFSSSKTSSRRLQNEFTRHFPKTSSRRLCKTTSSWLQDPVHTGRKLNVHKTFWRRPARLQNVLCTSNLRPVSTGDLFQYVFKMCLKNVFQRRLQGIFARPLQDVFKKTSHSYILKKSRRRLVREKNLTLKTCSRRLQDVFTKINLCCVKTMSNI